MANNNPIGLFDSGIGGTSIWKAIHELMPNESTIYLADSINAPYGQKTKEEIIALSFKNTEFLLNQNVKLIVVACNTATTNAIKELRAAFDIPFIGIEPAIKPAALRSKTDAIGVLATMGTINSELFHKAVLSYPETHIIEQIGHGLVQLIEEGKLESEEMTRLLHQYLQPMVAANIDHLVLGCTHYPYLIPQIKAIIPDNITIIDSGEAVAKQTKKSLESSIGLHDNSKPFHSFYTNITPDVLSNILNNQYKVELIDF